MSYRRKILSRLKDFYDKVGPGSYLLLDPIDIIKKPGDQKYVAAVNQLVSEGLIRGAVVKDSNQPAFCLNPDRIDDIEKELRWYRNPALQFWIPIVLTLAGLIWAIIQFLLKK